jgi:hypothetical protein
MKIFCTINLGRGRNLISRSNKDEMWYLEICRDNGGATECVFNTTATKETPRTGGFFKQHRNVPPEISH